MIFLIPNYFPLLRILETLFVQMAGFSFYTLGLTVGLLGCILTTNPAHSLPIRHPSLDSLLLFDIR